ncbi:MAG TPA: single-stranded DNA-binding protein, partial [Massilia sp.]|nr:single-stranded DNA-binding protein [Massilia sp.]
APRQAPPAPPARPQPQRPAPNFSDMDDDIPF